MKMQRRGIATRARIHDYMLRYQSANGQPPTQQEIANAIHLGRGHVRNHLITMEIIGMVARADRPGWRRFTAVGK